MIKRYEWYTITDGGLLMQSGINNYDGFETEEEAVKAYSEYRKEYGPFFIGKSYVLLTRYIHEDDIV